MPDQNAVPNQEPSRTPSPPEGAADVAVLETFLRATASLASELDLERLVQSVTDAGRELSGAEFGAFFYNVTDAEGESYTLYTLSGAPREAFQGFPMPRNTPLFAPTFTGETIVRSDDITRDPRYGRNDPFRGMPAGHLAVRSYLAVPVVSRGGEVLGGLFFGHPQAGVFRPEHERLLAGLATQAAVAIENARLYQRVRETIREQSRVEESLRESELRKTGILESALDCIVTMDAEGRIVDFNPAAERVFGYDRRDVIGRTVAETLIPPQFRVAHWAGLNRYLQTGEQTVLGRRLELSALCADGREIPVELAISVVKVEGQPDFFTAYLRDISERRRFESELIQARQDAEAASRSKSEFLANMSHEIRTPMTAILGYADVLAEKVRDPDDLECVETIKRNGRHLLEIINDILDLSKIEAGRLHLERQSCAPAQIVAEVCSLMEVRAQEKHIPLIAEYDGAIPETILSDPTRLRQILINLVANAIKFTDAGGVRLIVRFLAGDESGRMQFEVIDTGIGLSPEQQQRLFQPFTQADTSVTRRFGGTGLGLTISRRLAHMLGGEIALASEPGRGSTFTLTVAVGTLQGVRLSRPQPGITLSDAAPRAPQRLTGRILVVDDRRDIRYLAQHFLEDAGAEVATAENGAAGIEAVELAEQRGRPFDAVVMDMQMPVLDGYAATARLRARGFRRPIIALTAAAMPGDREKCLNAGCDDYTSKPIDGRQLVAILARYAAETGEASRRLEAGGPPSNARQEPAPGERSRAPSNLDADRPLNAGQQSAAGARSGPLRILLVDDSPDACTVMGMLLEMGGYEVGTAYSGQAALDAARARPPDVVLLDIGLPDMSGYDVCRRLRAEPGTRSAVMIAWSGRAEPEDRARAREAGFDHHVLKPADVEELQALFPR